MKTPPRRAHPLTAGARVALVAPGGPVTEERIESAIADCESFGFEPVIGNAARNRLGYLAGTDDDRTADLHRAFHDPSIDAVWALRGGYGAMRLLSALDLQALRHRSVPYIGFSDNTAIHLQLSRLGLVSFHGPHAGAVATDYSRGCMRDVLCNPAAPGRLPDAPDGAAVTTIAGGTTEGRLAGGNLSILAAMCGTPWSLHADGCIVVIEDVSEPAYRIDRALMQLRLAGSFDGVAGVVFGRFTERPTSDDERPLEEVLAEVMEPLGVPVILGAPVGHIDDQWTVPLGVQAQLDADAGHVTVIEPCVSHEA